MTNPTKARTLALSFYRQGMTQAHKSMARVVELMEEYERV